MVVVVHVVGQRDSFYKEARRKRKQRKGKRHVVVAAALVVSIAQPQQPANASEINHSCFEYDDDDDDDVRRLCVSLSLSSVPSVLSFCGQCSLPCGDEKIHSLFFGIVEHDCTLIYLLS